jgi:hypothetical protein
MKLLFNFSFHCWSLCILRKQFPNRHDGKKMKSWQNSAKIKVAVRFKPYPFSEGFFSEAGWPDDFLGKGTKTWYIFCQKEHINLFCEKSGRNILATFIVFLKVPIFNNRQNGVNSPNLVTLKKAPMQALLPVGSGHCSWLGKRQTSCLDKRISSRNHRKKMAESLSTALGCFCCGVAMAKTSIFYCVLTASFEGPMGYANTSRLSVSLRLLFSFR